MATNITLTRAENTGCLYRNRESGAVVDNVWVFLASDGVTKLEIVDKRGPYLARCGRILPGADRTSALQLILNDSTIKEVVFDYGDITIDGTLTVPAGKKLTFHGNGRLVGSGTVNGGVIDAGMRQNIFGSTLTVNPEGVSNSSGVVSAIWFGADPSGVSNSQPAIQKTIDTVARNTEKLATVFLPVGTYTCDNGILIYRKVGNNFAFHTINLIGEGSWWQNSIGGVKLIFTNKNSFGIGIQAGKGNRIAGFKIEGQFTPPSLTDRQFFNTELADYSDPTVINTSFAGYFGLVVDPFVNNTGSLPFYYDGPTKIYETWDDPGYGYPDWIPFYKDGGLGTNTGSTGLIFEDLFFTKWDACICFSPNTYTRNAEQIRGRKIQFDTCRIALCNTQDQEKTNTFQHMGCWADVHTVFAKFTWGAGTPGVYHVSDVNIAGRVNQFIDHVEGGYFASHFERIFTESMGKFGRLQSLKGATVINSEIGFSNPQQSKWQQRNVEASGVTFKNCCIRYYGEYAPVTLYGQSVYDGCAFEVTPFIGAWGDNASVDVGRIPVFHNCFVDSSTAGGGWCGSIGHQSSPIGLNSANKLISPFGKKRLFHTVGTEYIEYTHDVDYIMPHADIACGSKTVSKSINGSFEELVIPIAGTDKWLWGNGQKLAVYATGLGYVGNIHSVSDTEVIIRHPVNQWVDGTYEFTVMHPIWHHHFAGSVQQGSNVISNVIMGSGWQSFANMVGMVIEARAGVNTGTYSRWNIVIAQDGVNLTCLKNFYYTIDDCVFSTAESVDITPKNANVDYNQFAFKFIRGDKVHSCRTAELGKNIDEIVIKSAALASNALFKPVTINSEAPRVVSANYSPTIHDDLIVVNTGSGNITLQVLEKAYYSTFGGAWSGKYAKKITIVKSTADANSVIIAAHSGQNISGQATVELTSQYEFATILITDSGNYLLEHTVSAAPGSGITSLNGLNGTTQTFSQGNSGTDFNISSTGTVHTFNIPDAGASARGLVTTGAQSFAGLKTFNDGAVLAGGSLSGTDVYLTHLQTANSILFGVEAVTAYLMYGMGSRTIDFGTNTTGNLRIRNGGRTLIGELSDNTVDKLQVDGTIMSTSYTGTGVAPAVVNATGQISRGHAAPHTKIRVVDNVDFTIAVDDGTVVLKNNTTSINATLPSAASFTNRQIVIVNSGTGSILTSVNFRTNAGSTANLVQASETIMIQSDGTDWWLVFKTTSR